ncbi:hypothetical protein Tco_0421470 [Tanacetum coccineum]
MVTFPLRYFEGVTDWYLEPSGVSTSHISIYSNYDDESIESSISYIILSDSEAEGVTSPTAVLDYALVLNTDTELFEAPPSPDYAPALDADTEFLKAPASLDYTLGSDTEFEPSEHNPKE